MSALHLQFHLPLMAASSLTGRLPARPAVRGPNAALLRGDVDRYRTMVPYTDDFTLMSPFGGVHAGRGNHQ